MATNASSLRALWLKSPTGRPAAKAHTASILTRLLGLGFVKQAFWRSGFLAVILPCLPPLAAHVEGTRANCASRCSSAERELAAAPHAMPCSFCEAPFIDRLVWSFTAACARGGDGGGLVSKDDGKICVGTHNGDHNPQHAHFGSSARGHGMATKIWGSVSNGLTRR